MNETVQRLVLVVDDDSRGRELMQIVLRHAGFRVVAAENGTAAQALLAHQRPDAALVDFVMPGMNGIELCRWIRQQPDLGAMKLMLLTGMDCGEFGAELAEIGIDDAMMKPFDRADLLQRLTRLLSP